MKFRNGSLALACSAVVAVAAQQADACTSLVLNGNDGGRVYGRTMEFGIPLHSQVMKMPRGYANTGIGPDGTAGQGKSWKSKYAVIGANVFSLPFFVDGINEAGLVGGMLNAPNTALYQDVPAGQADNSIAPQQLLTYVLSNFATVEEVRQALPNIYVSNAPMKEWGGTPKARMTLHDAKGGSLVVEYLGGRLVMTDNVIGVMTNDPPFAWHLANIGNYANLGGPEGVAPRAVRNAVAQLLGEVLRFDIVRCLVGFECRATRTAAAGFAGVPRLSRRQFRRLEPTFRMAQGGQQLELFV